jgi:hypothetical protein
VGNNQNGRTALGPRCSNCCVPQTQRRDFLQWANITSAAIKLIAMPAAVNRAISRGPYSDRNAFLRYIPALPASNHNKGAATWFPRLQSPQPKTVVRHHKYLPVGKSINARTASLMMLPRGDHTPLNFEPQIGASFLLRKFSFNQIRNPGALFGDKGTGASLHDSGDIQSRRR